MRCLETIKYSWGKGGAYRREVDLWFHGEKKKKATIFQKSFSERQGYVESDTNKGGEEKERRKAEEKNFEGRKGWVWTGGIN